MKNSLIKQWPLVFCLMVLMAGPGFASDKKPLTIIASNKPVHSLVSAITNGIADPHLILDNTSSPHSYQLKPSQAGLLAKADIIFWIGEALEPFLEKPLKTIASTTKNIALFDAQKINHLPVRQDEEFVIAESGHQHNHDHDHDDHSDHKEEEGHDHHGTMDAHIWLDPENASVMAKAIAKALMAVDEANASRYEANLDKVIVKIDALTKRLSKQLAKLQDRRFLVFHDAYYHFENRFGLNAAGTILLSTQAPPSASRINIIRNKITQHEVVCIFAEPQFPSAILKTIGENTNARIASLDPLGSLLTSGPDLYFEMMQALADSFNDCLLNKT